MQNTIRNGFNRSQIIIKSILIVLILRRISTLYHIKSDIGVKNNERIKDMSFGYKAIESNDSKR
jgi:hypothetical protein